MYTVQQALQEGINDYNLWASTKGEAYNIPSQELIAYGELRGILYNKLRNPLKMAIPDITSLNKLEKVLSVENFICSFDSGQKNMLTHIKFEKRYRFYENLSTTELLRRLNEASNLIIYECYHDKVQYEIRNIITGIENFKVV